MSEGLLYLLIYAAVALAALLAGFFVTQQMLAGDDKRGRGFVLRLTLYGVACLLASPFVSVLGRLFGIGAVRIALFALVLLPPFWLGSLLALVTTKGR